MKPLLCGGNSPTNEEILVSFPFPFSQKGTGDVYLSYIQRKSNERQRQG